MSEEGQLAEGGGPTIRLLPDSVINQIAAGEVVERPASVLKELLDNALDAGAGRIEVDVVDGGRRLVRVRDDGCGMGRDNALMSIERHATSKLRDLKDLDRISTMGFRGEALAAIAAVSQFTLTTNRRGDVAGTEIVVFGGKVQDVRDAGAPPGTDIAVRNLFFNVPARRKFLRSAQTEYTHIRQRFFLSALSRPDVEFTLRTDDEETCRLRGGGDALGRVRDFYGEEVARALRRVSFGNGTVEVGGWAGAPPYSRADREMQVVMVNGRPAGSPILNYAIQNAYRDLLPGGRYAPVFLTVDLPGEMVDVNVHPAKREVRLSREKEISEEIVAAVREALESGNIHAETAPAGSGTAQTSLFSGTGAADAVSHSDTDPNAYQNTYTNTYPNFDNSNTNPNPNTSRLFCSDSGTDSAENGGVTGSLSDMESSVKALFSSEALRTDEGVAGYHPQFSTTDSQLRLTENFDYSDSDKIMLPPMEVVGQYDDAYIIARMKNQDGDELVIVDQHAAHERILYDKVSKIRNSKKNSQELLVPSVITLKPREAEVLMANRAFLEEEGFVIEEFGKDTFAVRSVPLVLGKRIGTEILSDILTDLMDDSRKTIEEKKDKITSTIACRAAIKAGAVLTREQMERLLNQLARTDLPYTCPHGRPTMILFSRSKLDSLFLRS